MTPDYNPWDGSSDLPGRGGGDDGEGSGGGGGSGPNSPAHAPTAEVGGEGMRAVLRPEKKGTSRGILKVPYIFQCPPLDSFSWSQDYEWTDVTTIGGKTISRPGARGLRQ